MIAFSEQLGALAVLVCGVYFGWRRWISPYRSNLDVQGTGMLMLAILAVAGGVIGSLPWWLDLPDSFSWPLPPLGGRLLGAAAIAFAVTGIYALEQRRERLVRDYIVMLAVYLGPLVAAILVLHLDRFDWSAPITYAFFVVAGGMALAALWHLARGTRLGSKFQASVYPAAAVVQAWLWFVAVIAGLWGLALFLYPQGPNPQIWVWPQDPLTSRLIASMLLTLATGALLGLRSSVEARMSLWMFAVYGSLAATACFWNIAAGKPVPASYAAAFCILAPVSLVLLAVRTTAIAAIKPQSNDS